MKIIIFSFFLFLFTTQNLNNFFTVNSAKMQRLMIFNNEVDENHQRNINKNNSLTLESKNYFTINNKELNDEISQNTSILFGKEYKDLKLKLEKEKNEVSTFISNELKRLADFEKKIINDDNNYSNKKIKTNVFQNDLEKEKEKVIKDNANSLFNSKHMKKNENELISESSFNSNNENSNYLNFTTTEHKNQPSFVQKKLKIVDNVNTYMEEKRESSNNYSLPFTFLIALIIICFGFLVSLMVIIFSFLISR